MKRLSASVGGSREILDDDSISSGSDTEEENEEEEFHTVIAPALLIGQTLTAYWPWTAFIDNAVDEDDISYENTDEGQLDRDGLHTTWNGSYLEPYSPRPHLRHREFPTPSPVHRRAPSLPSELQLDEIYVTSDLEYGFNPNRRRPSSLYHSGESFKFAEPRGSIASILGPTRTEKSYATNEKEAKLEAEVKHLRSQPSGVQFMRRCSTDINAIKQHAESCRDGKIGRKRLRAIRRQLSFDSQSRRKTVSDDRDLARLRGKCATRNRKTGSAVPFVRSRSRDEGDCHIPNHLENTVSSVSAEVLCSSNVNIAAVSQEVPQGVIAVDAPPILTEKIDTELFLRGESDPVKALDGKSRRRGSNSGFFGFRFPNKKAFKRLMRRRQADRAHVNAPVVPLAAPVAHSSNDFVDPVEVPCSSDSPGEVRAKLLPGDAPGSHSSLNSFRRPEKERVHKKGHPIRLLVSCAGVPLNKEIKSCSVRSLPKVEEDFEEEVETSKSLGSLDEDKHTHCGSRGGNGKASIEFDESFRRKSCSTCSIAVARHLRSGGSREDVQVLRRRMSDTALTLQDRTPGCSPGKRFVRKLLSPVVCGLPVDRYMTFRNDSMLSLASDSTSQASESELQQSQLFYFGLQEIAEELTLIDKELLIRISWQELANCSWMAKNKFSVAPNVMNMVDFFNRIAMLIATNVLAEETVQMRAKVISKVIKLARKCRLINNFNSLKAILGGLQCTPVYRLKTTWKHVSSRRKKQLKELTKLMSEIDNFKRYRLELNKCIMEDISCLPFLGDFLTQLAQTHAYLAVRRKFINTPRRTSVPRADSPLPNQQSSSLQPSPEHTVASDSLNRTLSKSVDSKLATSLPSKEDKVQDESTGESQSKDVELSDSANDNFRSNRVRKPDFLQVRQIPCAKESKRTHARSDSDDSGVVIDNNRLSRSSEDLDGSRENLHRANTSDYDHCSDGMSSPDGEGRDLELFIESEVCAKDSIFIRPEPSTDTNENEDRSASVEVNEDSNETDTTEIDPRTVTISEDDQECSECNRGLCSQSSRNCSSSSENDTDVVNRNKVSNDNLESVIDTRTGVENMGNNTEFTGNKMDKWYDYVTEEFAKKTRELEDNLRKKRLQPKDDKYQKELEFWKYQITAIQYRFPPRPHVRRFLLNTSYISEEENYRLSLSREPPEKVN